MSRLGAALSRPFRMDIMDVLRIFEDLHVPCPIAVDPSVHGGRVRARLRSERRVMLKQTLFATYVAQAYVSLIGLVLMPFYLRLMGVDAFALIGIFWMLQALVQLLDLGFTPALSREISRFRAGAITSDDAWRVLRGSEGLLGLLAMLVIAAFFWAKDWLARHWLGPTSLPFEQVAWSLFAMALAAALRWQAGLYRGGLVGLERQVWVSGAAVFFATARFVGVVPVILMVSPGPLAFFIYQAIVSIVELGFVRSALHRSLPAPLIRGFPGPGAVRPLLPVAGMMAFMSGIWILQTQVDKLLLSKLLSLQAFAHFTLAGMVSAAVLMLVPPLNQVLQPRLTILVAQGSEEELNGLYGAATQFVTAVFGALGLTLAFSAQPLLQAWTGDPAASAAAAPILVWYALANSLTGILVLPFTLQFARGYLRLQAIGSLLSVLILLPALYVAAIQAGAIGAGMTLFVVNTLYLLLWVPVIHARVLPGGAWRWLFRDVLLVLLGVSACVYSFSLAGLSGGNRWQVAAVAALVFAVSAFVGILAGSESRRIVHKLFRRMP